jgi:hypothetical protein
VSRAEALESAAIETGYSYRKVGRSRPSFGSTAFRKTEKKASSQATASGRACPSSAA